MMIRRPSKATPVLCRELVEQVTDYLEGGLTGDVRRRIDAHLEACADCARTIAQWREVVRLTGRLGDDEVDHVDEPTRARLLAAFRDQPPASD